jgi:hypothetical protein
MAYTLPLEVYQHIEDRFGRELATEVNKTIENAIAVMNEQAVMLVVQKKAELKEELTKELVTKAEFQGEFKALREEMKALEIRLTGEIKVLREETKATEFRLMGEIKTVAARLQGEIKALREEMNGKFNSLNMKLNFLIALMVLALTVMNPVVAELLKRWLKL